MQNYSIYNVVNNDALVVMPYWTHTLKNEDYNALKGKYIIGTKLIIITKLMQPFQPHPYEHQLNSEEQTYKNILFTIL